MSLAGLKGLDPIDPLLGITQEADNQEVRFRCESEGALLLDCESVDIEPLLDFSPETVKEHCLKYKENKIEGTSVMLSGIPSMPYLVKEEKIEDHPILSANLVKDSLEGSLLLKGSSSGRRSCVVFI